MTIYYAAVEGDPLSSHKDSYVIRGAAPFRIADQSGRLRTAARIGDFAFCAACGTEGTIVEGARLRRHRRTNILGRLQAVDGDHVACKCATMPTIFSVYGRRHRIIDDSEARPASAEVAVSSGFAKSSAALNYDETFTLRDHATGEPLANVRYRVRTGSGAFFEGTTDTVGRTQRIKTSKPGSIQLDVQL